MALALCLLLGVLATLVWLRQQLVAGQEQSLAATVGSFEATGVLGRPESPTIVFAAAEDLVRASMRPPLMALYVTKEVRGRGEVTIHPFHADLSRPEWRRERPWRRVPVMAGDVTAGWLYMDIDARPLRAVDGAIALVGLLLAAGFAVLVVRQRVKEAHLSAVISELESNRAQVIHLERLALAGQLSANIFHDIKKPVLNIKHEVADHLEGDGRTPDEVLRATLAQTELFLDMLRDLGVESFVNARDNEEEWCDLAEAVDRSLRLVRYEQEMITTEVDFPAGAHYLLHAAPHRLVQLFSNLALNAYQAMGEQGRLRIAARREGARLIVTVEDSGPGIPPERAETVFSPFVTTRASAGGSGLGLYICRTITEELGGTIRVDRSPDLGGARFTLDLPSDPLPPGPAPTAG
jgi:signal transduction histidine kinase